MAYSIVHPFAQDRSPISISKSSLSRLFIAFTTPCREASISSAIRCLESQIPVPSSLARSAIAVSTALRSMEPVFRL